MEVVKPIRRPHTRLSQLRRDVPHRILVGWLFSMLVIGGATYWYHTSIWRPGDPEAALTTVLEVASGNLSLSRASDVAWGRSMEKGRRWLAGMGSGSNLFAEWREFLTPTIPPIICYSPGGQAGPGGEFAPLSAAVRSLGESRREGLSTRSADSTVAVQIDRLTAAHRDLDGSFLFGYNLAVAESESRRAQAAVQELTQIGNVFGPEFMPSLNRTRALAFARREGVDQEEVVRTFLGRYLTGVSKLWRSEVTDDAIVDFRYAINAVNYLYPGRPMPRGHAAETEIPLYTDWACDPDPNRSTLTSLDAYAGLVAAYLASPQYTNPEPDALRRELARDPDEMDRTDPLREIVLYGQSAGASGVIPENVLWAASNLQRLLQINRLTNSKRLTAVRTVLGLQVLSRRAWVDALEAQHGFTACRFLQRSWEDLDALGRRYWAMDIDRLTPTDNVVAGLAVFVGAASYDYCSDPIQVNPDSRSGLLRAGLEFLPDALPGIYDQRRFLVERSRSFDSALEDMLGRVESEAAMFERNQPPAEIEQNYDLTDANDFVLEWNRALFRDVAEALAAEGAASRGQPPGNLSAEEFLLGLESAVSLVGTRPSDIYEWSTFVNMAGRVGPGFARSMERRYWARSNPELHWLRLGTLSTAAVVLLTWVHLAWWRWRLIAGVQYPRQRLRWVEVQKKKHRTG